MDRGSEDARQHLREGFAYSADFFDRGAVEPLRISAVVCKICEVDDDRSLPTG